MRRPKAPIDLAYRNVRVIQTALFESNRTLHSPNISVHLPKVGLRRLFSAANERGNMRQLDLSYSHSGKLSAQYAFHRATSALTQSPLPSAYALPDLESCRYQLTIGSPPREHYLCSIHSTYERRIHRPCSAIAARSGFDGSSITSYSGSNSTAMTLAVCFSALIACHARASR